MAELLSARARALIEKAAKATPGPWASEYDNGEGGEWYRLSGPRLSWTWNDWRAEEQAKIDVAALDAICRDAPDIAKAYLEAVEIVKNLSLQVEYLHGKFQPTSSGVAELSRAEAFLARIEGE